MVRDDLHPEGTTKAGRILRTWFYDKNRATRMDLELYEAERRIANAADFLEMDGGDPGFLRRLAQDVRNYQAQCQRARSPR